jgi:hypothetical protein
LKIALRFLVTLAMSGVPLIGMQGSTAHAAKLGDNTVKLLPSKFKLLQNIGPMRFTGENSYTDRRLGRSFGYGASGISLIVYVYDYGLRDLPDGPDSVAACEQFERAKHEIEQGGNYQNVVLVNQVTRRMRDSADAPLAREALYEFDRNGVHAWSYLWLTAADGYFVKLRLSLREDVKDEMHDARMEILTSVAEAIAARPARAAVSPVARAAETSVEMDPLSDPAEAPLWFSYAAELLRATRETPGALPPCGGPLAPLFATELAARRAALRDYAAREATARSSEYFTQLARVDAAGFLEEYAWHYLRRSTEQNAPAELDLAGFESFRLRELATHEVKTGARVRVNTVRMLPLEPAP